jgi:poly(3-hydroxyalkanoate) synthetase
MRRREGKQAGFPSAAFMWPWYAAASASNAAASFAEQLARAMSIGSERPAPEPPTWASPNKIALELPSMRLRRFSKQKAGPPTLVCAPYALHGATIADFAPGHSLVEFLHKAGRKGVFVTEWRSATPEMRFFTIDTYLADLNVAVDEVGAPVDLIGLCQGGWMALLYTARFPHKVRRLVIAGAPVDIRAGISPLSLLTDRVPIGMFEHMVEQGGGRLLGESVLHLWGHEPPDSEAVRHVLQLPADIGFEEVTDLEVRFRRWFAWTVDLPGTYYLQVVNWLFKENRIVDGRFVALGHPVDLRDVRVPVFLLAARDDELVACNQLFAIIPRLGTPREWIATAIEPCGHLGLFMGADTLAVTWQVITRWMAGDFVEAGESGGSAPTS